MARQNAATVNKAAGKPGAHDPAPREERIRILAYQRWQAATGGTPVDDEQTRRFWADAEKDVDAG